MLTFVASGYFLELSFITVLEVHCRDKVANLVQSIWHHLMPECAHTYVYEHLRIL